MQNRNRIIEMENIGMVASREAVLGNGGKGEGTKKYKLVVVE